MLGNAAGLHPMASLRVADGAEMPEDFVQNGGFWEKEIREDQDMPGLISELIRREVPIYEALIRRPTLEDVYFSLVQKPEDGEVENRA